MATLATIAFYLGVIAYSAASTLFFLDLVRRDGASTRATWAPRLLGLAAAFHAVKVAVGLSREAPMESLHLALSFSALCAAGVYLLVHRRANLFATGAIVAPVALTFLVASQFVGAEARVEDGISRPLLAFHIAANVLGVGLFVVAGASGILYLFQERRLRAKQLGTSSNRLPSLDTLDRATHRLLVIGFPLLTFGVVTGAVFSGHWEAMEGAALARSLFGYATWVVLAAVLVARRVAGVRGRRAAYGTLAGVLCVLLVVLVYALKPGGHGS